MNTRNREIERDLTHYRVQNNVIWPKKADKFIPRFN